MNFNSLDFAIFLPITFCIYWSLKNHKKQNFLLLISNYIFYGWWDWRFLSLIIASSIVDFTIALFLIRTQNPTKRKIILTISLITNLGILIFFKYLNFFIESFHDAFSFAGFSLNTNLLNVILPIGISFYTFQTISYTIDVYRKKIKPTNNIVSFFSYVSFFPQLVAGPIERASNLLPQFNYRRKFNYINSVDGLKQILWGMFKKVVIADNCAYYVNLIFSDPSAFSGSTLLLALLLFSFQIYGDFSGYSDIAIGTAKLFGFNLRSNFNYPYFSRYIHEFWKRWHISLSSWFRDYLYIPLGGNRCNKIKTIRNILLVFLVSGLWHGANYTFILWGILNAIYLIPSLLNPTKIKESNPSLTDLPKIITCFLLISFSWVFFRSENIGNSFSYIYNLFSPSLFSIPSPIPQYEIITIGIFLAIEWAGRNYNNPLKLTSLLSNWKLRYLIYYALIYSIIFHGGNKQDFIYFQF
jgi:D-alanyl-lipoteichoic acid acyltransferase DltB (MBOAT superfamily)